MTREEAIRVLEEFQVIDDWTMVHLPPMEDAVNMAIEALSADRPKNMIHIDEVYRLIAGHSNYHGDSILSAFTCLVEGKDVKPIAPLDESADRPTGEWVDDCTCSICHWMHEDNNGFALITKYNYCPNCGAKMGGEPE